MSLITTGNYPKAKVEGIKAWFNSRLDRHPTLYTALFDVEKSARAFEEYVQDNNFGLVEVKDETDGIKYKGLSQGWIKRFTHLTYARGFMVTLEEKINNLYMEVGKNRAASLAFAFRATKETVHANVINRAFNTSYLGGDGKALCVTDHPNNNGSTFSNALDPAADISEAALEDMVIMIMGATDGEGNPRMLLPESLHVHRNDWFEATRIVKSVQQNDTANNATNVLNSQNTFPKGVFTNPYFSDTDAYIIKTNCPMGLKSIDRLKLTFDADNDFDTKNDKYAGIAMYSAGWVDPWGVCGSAGG